MDGIAGRVIVQSMTMPTVQDSDLPDVKTALGIRSISMEPFVFSLDLEKLKASKPYNITNN